MAAVMSAETGTTYPAPQGTILADERIARAESLRLAREVLSDAEDVSVTDFVSVGMWIYDGHEPWGAVEPAEGGVVPEPVRWSGVVAGERRKLLVELRDRFDRSHVPSWCVTRLDKIIEEMTQ